jgi:GMP synthase (glutamine-hydrolysing)
VQSSVLVVQNDPDKPLGRIADGLGHHDVALDVRSPNEALPDVRRYAGLVVLPGLADPVDDTSSIRRVRDVIDASLGADLPILGLCLGGQLLAQALGGSVYPCRPELGFHDVVGLPAASSDPLLSRIPRQFSIFHAHAYAFTPPSGAEILLTNDVCVQACRHGRTWAFQCHPEISSAWVAALAAAIRGQDGALLAATTDFFARNGVAPEQLERGAAIAEPAMRDVAAGIAGGFAAELA